jgi:hypothetical protein
VHDSVDVAVGEAAEVPAPVSTSPSAPAGPTG